MVRSFYFAIVGLFILLGASLSGCTSEETKPKPKDGSVYYEGPIRNEKKPE